MSPSDTSPVGARAEVVYAPPDEPDGSRLPSRGLVLAVLVGVLVFAGGFLAGRGSLLASQRADSPVVQDQPAAPDRAAPGQVAPEPPAAPVDGPVTSPGPTGIRNGVPVGYARSPEGAVAAAANYTVVLSGPAVLDEARRTAAVAVLAAPDAEPALQDSTRQTAELLTDSLRLGDAGPGQGSLVAAVPVRAKVERYDEDVATVAIWQTSLGGAASGAPVRQGWGITTVELRWAGDDWKYAGASTRPGPVPLADDAPPTEAADLISTLEGFKEYSYAPAP